MTEYEPSLEEMAAIIQSQGIQPDQNESTAQFQARIDDFMRNNQHLRKEEYDYYLNNRQRILDELKKKLKIKFALVAIGHAGKWAKSSFSALKTLASKMGLSGIKNGWGQLANVTIQTGMNEMLKNTFIRTLGSKTTWIVAAVVGGVQIGYEFYRLCKGEIGILDFAKNSIKIITVTAAGAVGGAGGAVLGAAIGALGGPVGVFIGIGIGGFIGGMGASKATEVGIEWVEDKIKQMNHHKIYKKALAVLDLPLDYSNQNLEDARLAKYKQFHPDKWNSSSDSTQMQIKAKLAQALQCYEIIVNYRK